MAMAGFASFLLGVILLICYPIGKRKNKRGIIPKALCRI